jgi:hypothetical protein
LQTLSSIPALCGFTFMSTPPCFTDTRKYRIVLHRTPLQIAKEMKPSLSQL